MKIGARGLALIKSYEKLRLKAYLPTPNDVWTIGWGHTKGVAPGLTCIPAQADAWLVEDCAEAEGAVNALTCPLTQNQYDALVSFVFNVGVPAFRTSTMRRLLEAREYALAAAQFPRWNKQKGVVLNGLTRRRAEEAALFLSEDPAP